VAGQSPNCSPGPVREVDLHVAFKRGVPVNAVSWPELCRLREKVTSTAGGCGAGRVSTIGCNRRLQRIASSSVFSEGSPHSSSKQKGLQDLKESE